jgi:hypothetical protein
MRPPVPEPIGIRSTAIPVRVVEVCVRCKSDIDGWLYVDRKLAVVDSVGFVLTGDGATCDPCVGRRSNGTIATHQ